MITVDEGLNGLGRRETIVKHWWLGGRQLVYMNVQGCQDAG